MKIKIPYDYDRLTHQEVGVELNIPEHIVHTIIKSFFMQLDYEQRQRWMRNNLDPDDVKHISEEQLYE